MYHQHTLDIDDSYLYEWLALFSYCYSICGFLTTSQLLPSPKEAVADPLQKKSDVVCAMLPSPGGSWSWPYMGTVNNSSKILPVLIVL